MDAFSQKLINNLRQNDVLKDITFVIDNSEIKANRSLLAASCPYFERMLFGETNEANKSIIELHGTPREAFQVVMEFISKGNCELTNVDEITIASLLRLAHEYQFEELLSYLLLTIKYKDYSVEFCKEIYEFANITGLDDCKIECVKVFESLFINEVNLELFATFSRALVDQLTGRDTFAIEEMDLFRCIMKWKDVNKSDSHEGLFSNLRLNLISIADFNQFIIPANVISSDSYIKALVEDKFKPRMNKTVADNFNYNNVEITELTISQMKNLQQQNELRRLEIESLKTQYENMHSEKEALHSKYLKLENENYNLRKRNGTLEYQSILNRRTISPRRNTSGFYARKS